MYAGALTPTYEVDVVIEAIAALRAARPELRVGFDVYGRGDAAEPGAAVARDRGVEDRVTFHGRIPIEDVPAAIAGADIGVAPTRRDPFTDVSLSTKVFEYAAMGKPVVASRLPMVEDVPGDRLDVRAGRRAGPRDRDRGDRRRPGRPLRPRRSHNRVRPGSKLGGGVGHVPGARGPAPAPLTVRPDAAARPVRP